MITKQMDVRTNIKKYFDLAFEGEPIFVSRKQNKNVVIISEAEYNRMKKEHLFATYQEKIQQSREQN